VNRYDAARYVVIVKRRGPERPLAPRSPKPEQ
jgi:hypothetical protein